MPWTFEQRILRACEALVERNLIDHSQIETMKRPLYFGIHSYAVGMSLNLARWGDWFESRDLVASLLQDFNCTIMPNRGTYQFNVFSSDPQVLRLLAKQYTWLHINHVRIVDRSCWQLSLPKPKPKGKYYGEYSWRFEFKDPNWGGDLDNVAELEKLSGKTKLVTYPRTFLYLDKLNDVLMFKLIVGEQLLSLDDRRSL
jgi:hypothetical protein